VTAFLLSALALVPALLVAIPVHELGHGVAAYLLGDRSVRYFGYFRADPRRFLDLLGSIAVFIALVGWGRRVPIQPNRISSVRQRVLYSLGGPAANLAVGIVLGIVLRVLLAAQLVPFPEFSVRYIAWIVYAVWFLNLSIFAFQLLPIPGLDGWDIVEALFRSRNARFFFDVSVRRREIWVGLIVIAFLFQLFQGGSLLSLVMSPFYTPASLISLGQCAGYAVQGFVGLHPCLVP
jgi:Zn-dependent protease